MNDDEYKQYIFSLKKATSDEDRERAAKALGDVKVNTGPAIEALLQALKLDEAFFVKRQCIMALEKIDDHSPKVLAALQETAYSGGHNESGDAIRCLGKFANISDEALNILVEMLTSPDKEQRVTYALATITRESPKVVTAMTRCLDSSNSYVREAAANYFKKAKIKSSHLKEKLLRLLRDEDSHYKAVETLQAIGADITQELKKLGSPLPFLSVVHGMLCGWLSRDKELSLARKSSLLRLWPVPVGALFIGLTGYLAPNLTPNELVKNSSLVLVAAIGVFLCTRFSWTYRHLLLFFSGLVSFLIVSFISLFLLKELHGSSLFILAGFFTIPAFLIPDLSVQIAEYVWLLKHITESICPNCGRLMKDTSYNTLVVSDTSFGANIIRDHNIVNVKGKKICPRCGFQLRPGELSSLELYNRYKKALKKANRKI